MEIENIKDQYYKLSAELKRALGVMQRSDRVFAIRDEIKALQALCPHNNGSFDFTTEASCPYCGKRFKE